MINERRLYKNKEYKILHLAQMKQSDTREWNDCVVYEQLESGLIFCREKKEFMKLFKKMRYKLVSNQITAV